MGQFFNLGGCSASLLKIRSRRMLDNNGGNIVSRKKPDTNNPFHCMKCGERGSCVETQQRIGRIIRRYKCECRQWKTEETTIISHYEPLTPVASSRRQRLDSPWLERINRQLADCTPVSQSQTTKTKNTKKWTAHTAHIQLKTISYAQKWAVLGENAKAKLKLLQLGLTHPARAQAQ